jgi:hypothetical protein
MTRSVTENETDDRTAKRTELKEQATKTKEDASDLVGLVRDVAREEFAHWRSAATEGVTGHP